MIRDSRGRARRLGERRLRKESEEIDTSVSPLVCRSDNVPSGAYVQLFVHQDDEKKTKINNGCPPKSFFLTKKLTNAR